MSDSIDIVSFAPKLKLDVQNDHFKIIKGKIAQTFIPSMNSEVVVFKPKTCACSCLSLLLGDVAWVNVCDSGSNW